MNAHAGGGEQTVMQKFEEPVDAWHQINHFFGDLVGYNWVVGLAIFAVPGALWFLRKRIKRFFE